MTDTELGHMVQRQSPDRTKELVASRVASSTDLMRTQSGFHKWALGAEKSAECFGCDETLTFSLDSASGFMIELF